MSVLDTTALTLRLAAGRELTQPVMESLLAGYSTATLSYPQELQQFA